MRYWSGAEVHYASDTAPAVIVTGAPDTRVIVPGDIWQIESTRRDGAKIWRLVTPGKLVRSVKPLDDSLSGVLSQTLETMPTNGLHPALKNTLQGEAKRLYPEIVAEAVADVQQFIGFLRDEFGLENTLAPNAPLVPFVDDFGPEMIAFVDGRAVVLPEIPPVYQASEDWRRTQWWVSNHLLGPALLPEVPLERKMTFQGDIPASADTETRRIEGLVYFHALRSSLAGDAWRQTPDAPLTRGLVQIIMELGQRPWQMRNR
jgi:hypothetical protein